MTTAFTALTTIGASRQKQFLRFLGAAVGGFVFGMGAQILHSSLHRYDFWLHCAVHRGARHLGVVNWRGPIWFPMNFLLVESLQRFHFYFGNNFKVECPTGSGKYLTLWEVVAELSRRQSSLFTRNGDGRRPVYGEIDRFQSDEHWRDLLLFHEYFHGDSGAVLGASHQTGWTALVAKLMQQSGEKKSETAVGIAAVAAD